MWDKIALYVHNVKLRWKLIIFHKKRLMLLSFYVNVFDLLTRKINICTVGLPTLS